MNRDLVIFTGNGNEKLARQICRYLNRSIGAADVGRFPDGEISMKIQQDVRGADVYVVQSTSAPVNDHLMELLIMCDCLRRASAQRITAVIPYLGYARQDRKDEGRVPITAKLVADMITVAGVDRVLSMDLHAAQIQGFFNIPVDHIYARPVFIDYFAKKQIPDLCVASPDIGSVKRAWSYCRRLEGYLATVEKRRISPTETEVQFVMGDVSGKNVILVDDMIATGGTVAEAARILKQKGAKDIYLCATHGVFAGNACEKLANAPFKEIVTSDTIPVPEEKAKKLSNLKILSVANLLGEAVRRIHFNESVSMLFQEGPSLSSGI